MRLIKRSDSVTKEQNQLGISRRAFMKNTSLAAGGAAVGASLFTPGMIRKAQASEVDRSAKTEVKRTICSHCSVGCGIYAEVQNGVWTCLLYTSDAADDSLRLDLGGRRIIKKK